MGILRNKVIAVALAATALSNVVSAEIFSDMVPKEHWAYTALNWAVQNKILTGFGDGTIKSNESLTRAQLATIVSRTTKLKSVRDIVKFPDISVTAWYYESIKKAYTAGLINGYSDGFMYPDKKITRQEAFTIVARMLGDNKKDGKTSFGDDDLIADWARPSVKWLAEEKLVSGNAKGNVNPNGLITRAEFAQLMYNICGKEEKSTHSDDSFDFIDDSPVITDDEETDNDIIEDTDNIAEDFFYDEETD